MGIFGKKKQEKLNCRVKSVGNAEKSLKKATVEILGSGCKKCNQLEKNTLEALNQLGIDADVRHITDFSQIAQYGVMSTPSLVVNGKVVSCGKVLTVNQAKDLLKSI